MKNLLILIALSGPSVYSQSDLLTGKWILERTIYENGQFLEINNPMYSSFISMEFLKKGVKINDKHFNAEYFEDSIAIGFRRINFEFQDGYLLLQEKNDDKISIYTKYEDYLIKNPEFVSEIEFVNNDTILRSNEVIKPTFNHKLSLSDFLRKKIDEYPRQQTKNVLFKYNFILTRDNKIRDIKVVKSSSAKFDEQFSNALIDAENYLTNTTDYDILVEHKFNFVKMHKYYNSENAKLFSEVHKKAKEYYQSNQFENVIAEYSKFDFESLSEQQDRFKPEIRQAYLILGISYLAIDEKIKACATFKKIGDKKNFYVRNYLIDFCQN